LVIPSHVSFCVAFFSSIRCCCGSSIGYGWIENFCDMAFMFDDFICFVLSKLVMVRLIIHVGKNRVGGSFDLIPEGKHFGKFGNRFASFLK
jgi:hypothetical protein